MDTTHPSTPRRKTRAVALQVLHEIDAVGRDPVTVLEGRLAEEPLSPEADDFARHLVRGALENRDEIDKIISRFAPSWPLSQMAIVDRNILRIAIYEMALSDDTPPKVAINEAVELAKVFGSDSSPRFVNGVLGSVMKTVDQGAVA